MADQGAKWQIDDKVLIWLPDNDSPGRTERLVSGTVAGLDNRGVQVELAETVSGVDNCYASHGELIPRG